MSGSLDPAGNINPTLVPRTLVPRTQHRINNTEKAKAGLLIQKGTSTPDTSANATSGIDTKPHQQH
ncbi:MAG: hypothetical protein K0U36_06940 [Alphaproteobacteria bacterium]|nr:hypothetical protein [Alphaproteobacteria bacterium]